VTRDVPGTVYLLHLDPPYKHARHYLGWAADLAARLAEHEHGQGARLLAVQKAAGGTWHLARTWPGATRNDERRIKDTGHVPHYCPDCQPERSAARRTARQATTPRKDTEMGIFSRNHAARDAAFDTARAWREYQQDQQRAAQQPQPEPQPPQSGVFHTGPGTLDVSGQVIGPGHTVTTPEGTTTTPGTPAPARQRQVSGGGGYGWHNDGVQNHGAGQVTISGDTVMGCGQTVTREADREAG
jgi:predicted GIY-YIG superfamily endonuclease